MSLLDRFMGHSGPDDPPGSLIAAADVERPLSLQVLFAGPFEIDADALSLVLRSYDPELRQGRAELMTWGRGEEPPAAASETRRNAETRLGMQPPASAEQSSEPPGVIGLAGWGPHVVKLVGFQAPIPPEVFEACVRPAHFTQQLKQDAAAHRSHVLLYYAGREADALEQYVALMAVAVALARFDALLILNEAAHAAFPAEALLAEEGDADRLAMLRVLPIPLLYGGFVKLEVEGEPGVWMRTHGNHLLGLPDLAAHVEGHNQGGETFDLFANMLAYLRETGSSFAVGHTMQVGEHAYLRLRTPTEAEWFLASDGELFVAERIGADEINE